MKFTKPISDAVIKRLPRYRRYLKKLQTEGVEHISSSELGAKMDLTASQIRQDLNHFGGFGLQGYGYSVTGLRDGLGEVIGLNKQYNVIFIGCGRLGQAIANFIKNNESSYNIIGMFDIREDLYGKEIAGVPVSPNGTLPAFVASNNVDIAILTIPDSQVETVTEILANSSVKGIWNFSLSELAIPGKKVMNMHLSDELHSLTYYINNED